MSPAFSLQRILRGLAVIPFIVFWMIFPIGVLTGAMTNLNTAVCGGTPGGWQRLQTAGSLYCLAVQKLRRGAVLL